jgi:serine/threonine protein kinase
MIEIGLGKYPYPPETYSNVFAQLTAIVHGDPPELPEEHYSETARDWVNLCLRKDPEKRATYRELLARLLFFSFLVLDNKMCYRTTPFSSKTAIAMLTWLPGCRRP